MELDECQQKYDHFLRNSRKQAFLTKNQLCAGDDKVRKWGGIVTIKTVFSVPQADACGGDSGGPLLHLNSDYSWMVVGIVSFGPSSCAREVPGVYTKVSSYLDWIKENTGFWSAKESNQCYWAPIQCALRIVNPLHLDNKEWRLKLDVAYYS